VPQGGKGGVAMVAPVAPLREGLANRAARDIFPPNETFALAVDWYLAAEPKTAAVHQSRAA